MLDRPQILICCVLYNQDLSQSKTYKSLLKGEKNVFLYDNSPQTSVKKTELPTSWQYEWNKLNPGLSYAYNKMALYAQRKGYKWILICDQDTLFPEGALHYYEECVNHNPTIPLIIPIVMTTEKKYMSPILSSHYIPRSKVNPSEFVGKIIKFKNWSIINSGMLINLEAFKKVGGYNEKVFLDFSDYQFIENLSRNYSDALIVNVLCIQSFSNEDQSRDQKINRYKLFCASLKGYHCNRSYEKIYIYRIMFRRCMSLCINTHSLKPLGIFIRSLFV